MRSFYKLSLFVLFINILYAIEAQAVIPWHVTDTWVETTKVFAPEETVLDKKITNDIETKQFYDSEGNRVESSNFMGDKNLRRSYVVFNKIFTSIRNVLCCFGTCVDYTRIMGNCRRT
jgi:hypothetical protein